jgi:hypothetical protein
MNVGLDWPRASHAFELAVLPDAQKQRLQLGGEFADLFQEDGAAVGFLEFSFL